MQHTITSMLIDLPDMVGTTKPISVEHSYDKKLSVHQFWTNWAWESGTCTLVVLHPYLCGCDALTTEFVLHG